MTMVRHWSLRLNFLLRRSRDLASTRTNAFPKMSQRKLGPDSVACFTFRSPARLCHQRTHPRSTRQRTTPATHHQVCWPFSRSHHQAEIHAWITNELSWIACCWWRRFFFRGWYSARVHGSSRVGWVTHKKPHCSFSAVQWQHGESSCPKIFSAVFLLKIFRVFFNKILIQAKKQHGWARVSHLRRSSDCSLKQIDSEIDPLRSLTDSRPNRKHTIDLISSGCSTFSKSVAPSMLNDRWSCSKPRGLLQLVCTKCGSWWCCGLVCAETH